jgi:hypothetical protein
MSENSSMKDHIINTLKEKSVLKQQVYDKTRDCLKILKKVLLETVSEYEKELKGTDGRVNMEYRDRGMFEAELKVAGDLLVFNMHSNVFEFPRNHEIWKDTFHKDQPLITYSGVINFYNFLSDSFKYNRLNDHGYLIGRMFINKDYTFFIEGRRELGFSFPAFGQNAINYENIKQIVESSIAYALKFDLLVPPFNAVNLLTVSQMKEKYNKSRMQTGKRLGFEYNALDSIKKK